MTDLNIFESDLWDVQVIMLLQLYYEAIYAYIYNYIYIYIDDGNSYLAEAP